MHVVVIGAGVSGVGSAVAIQESLPDVKVTIVTSQLTPNTTSDGAAGLWGPHLLRGDKGKIARWARETHELLHRLWLEGQCPGIGVVTGVDTTHPGPWKHAYFYCQPLQHIASPSDGKATNVAAPSDGKTAQVAAPSDGKTAQVAAPSVKSNNLSVGSKVEQSMKNRQVIETRTHTPQQNKLKTTLAESKKYTTKHTQVQSLPLEIERNDGVSAPCKTPVKAHKEIHENHSKQTENDLQQMHQWDQVRCKIVTFYVEPSKLLPYLLSRFQSCGGKILIKTVTSLDQLFDYDVIVNCTGLASRALMSDPDIYPVRGQVIRVRAPHIKNVICQDTTCIIPNDDVIILGGTHQEHNWQTTSDNNTTKQILHLCSHLVPSLASAPTVSEWAGLRPFRQTGIRLEMDRHVMNDNGRSVPVIHNYGHGGAGVTLFWGCGRQVAALVKQHVQQLQATSRL